MSKDTKENSRIRVLVVDDHAIIRKGIRAVLEIVPDIELVGEAENGKQALQMDLELQPDVILMDLMMPEMDGINQHDIHKRSDVDLRHQAVVIVAGSHPFLLSTRRMSRSMMLRKSAEKL